MDCTGSKFDLFDPPIGLRERERIEMLANVYSIIAATDYLERAFARDSVNSAEYAKECAALISKFKTFSKVLGPSFNAKEFAESYGVSLCLQSLFWLTSHRSQSSAFAKSCMPQWRFLA